MAFNAFVSYLIPNQRAGSPIETEIDLTHWVPVGSTDPSKLTLEDWEDAASQWLRQSEGPGYTVAQAYWVDYEP